MFEAITDSIRGALSFIDRGRLTDANIRDGLRQVRQALLEADVNYEVAQEFIGRVTEQAVGETVLKALRPSEQIVHIVYEELVNLMGPVDHSLHIKRDGMSVIMMCGLQGSGKTTTCGKLARMLKEQGLHADARRRRLAAPRRHRPAQDHRPADRRPGLQRGAGQKQSPAGLPQCGEPGQSATATPKC